MIQAGHVTTGIPAKVLEIVLSLNWDDAAATLQDAGYEAWDANIGGTPDYRIAGPKGEVAWVDIGGSTVNY